MMLASFATAGAQTYEQGFTFRLFHIQEDMDRLYPLIDGQTPNVDEKHATIDYESDASFAGFSSQFQVELSGRLEIPTPGDYEFRLTSDEGSILSIDGILVVNNDGSHGPVAVSGGINLATGPHPFEIRYFESQGGQRLLLEWRPPGEASFVTVPATAFSTLAGVTRVVAPGKKAVLRPGGGVRPGFGAPLTSVHPSWEVRQARPASFEPKVGALAVHPDGRLFVTTFVVNQNHTILPPGGDGKLWALTNADQDDPSLITVIEVANGFSEPLGLKFIDGDPVISQRLSLTRLKDLDSDGFYETHETITDGWVSDNYHHFHFGLAERDGFAYSTLSTAINTTEQFPGQSVVGLNGPNPPNRGTLLKTNLATGESSFVAGGLRTPNGLALGPENTILNTDNQGAWVPSSKLQILEEGKFYGHYNATHLTNEDYPTGGAPSTFSNQPPTPPTIWLPQNEIANSPSQPIPVESGLFAGHYFFGEITLGGVRRASFEKVNGKWQGCAYRFSQGFEGGVNRLAWAPDGSLYIGCIGASSNWSWNGTTFGLQRLKPKSDGTVAFEIKEVRAEEDGFSVEYTKPIDTAFASEPGNFTVKQWTYTPTAEYGGVKQDQSTLSVSESALSPDGRTVRLVVPGLKEGYVHHLSADLPSAAGETLWSAEAWYTLNAIPGDPSGNPVGELAFDDFSTYAEGVAVNGQDGGGTLTGFGATSWTANGAVQVNGGAFNQGANSLRSSRSFSATPLAASGTIYVRANLALSNADSGVNFSALELATTLNSDADAVRLIGSSAGLSVGVTGTGGAGSGSLLANDGANHEWLMEIDLSTKAGQVWIDPDIEGFDPAVGGTAFTVSSGFALNGINVATFGGSSSVVLDGFRIGGTLADVGVGAGDSPTLSFIAPIDDAGNVPVAVTPVATFSKPVALTGSGSIMLKNLSGGTDIPVALPGDVDIIGAVLTITPGSPLVAGEEYAVEITSNALEDLSVPAAPYAGILATDVPNWSFTTDGTSPGVDLLSPMAGAAEVSPNADLSLSFDEPVVVGTGHVTVHLAEGTLVETIDVTSGAVTITGNSVSIDVGDLALSTAYYVNIDVGAFIDLAGNGFGGITDTTTWSFTTWAAPTLPLAFDDFSTYSEAVAVNGQDGGGALTGFGATSWTANGAVQVNGGAFNQAANSFRSRRPFSATPLAASGTIYVRANLALSNADSGVNFSALELATTLNSDADAVRLIGSSAGLSVGVTGAGGAGSGSLLANDGANHEWLMEIDLSTKAGQVWIDPDLGDFDPAAGGTAFTVSSGFALNGINVATFGGSSSVVADDLAIGESWDSIGVTLSSGPSNTFNHYISDPVFGLDPAEQGFALDPDGDGLANGLEAWFGTHPGEFNPGFAELATDGTTSTFTHPQNESPPSDLTGFYEWSSNLSDWHGNGGGPGGGPTVSFVPNTVGTTTTVTATSSEPLDRLFIRAGVTQD